MQVIGHPLPPLYLLSLELEIAAFIGADRIAPNNPGMLRPGQSFFFFLIVCFQLGQHFTQAVHRQLLVHMLASGTG